MEGLTDRNNRPSWKERLFSETVVALGSDVCVAARWKYRTPLWREAVSGDGDVRSSG